MDPANPTNNLLLGWFMKGSKETEPARLQQMKDLARKELKRFGY